MATTLYVVLLVDQVQLEVCCRQISMSDLIRFHVVHQLYQHKLKP